MEVAGVGTCRMSLSPCFGTDSSDRRTNRLVASVSVSNRGWELGDRRKRSSVVTCGERKERRKLVERLAKDLALLGSMQFGIDPRSGLAERVQESTMTEATGVILRQLQSLREADEEARRKRKQEKKKNKLKSNKISTEVLGVDCDCESTTDSGDAGNQISTIFNSSWKEQPLSTQARSKLQVLLQSSNHVEKEKQRCHNVVHDVSSQFHPGPKKVEVCINGKCRKSGGLQLMEQFQTLAAEKQDMNVAGGKCMGMCKKGPNVRLSAANRAPAVCSGVQMSDVELLLASFLDLK